MTPDVVHKERVVQSGRGTARNPCPLRFTTSRSETLVFVDGYVADMFAKVS